MDDPAKHEKALKDDLKVYTKLKAINSSQEVNDFIQLVIDVCVGKMMDAFIGDKVNDWDEYCKLRGEIFGLLYPIQQIRSADAVTKKLREQLDNYYNSNV